MFLMAGTGLGGCGNQEGKVAEETATEIVGEAVSVEKIPEVNQRDFCLMKTVCLESMSLRDEPGFSSTVIETLYPGTELEWLGEIEKENEIEFYRVRVLESGNEGYCSAAYCIRIYYEYTEDALSYVETDNAIYSYEMMAEDIQILSEKYPDRLSVKSLGQSVEGREIYQVVLGNPAAERAVFIQAGIHGREYMSSQLIMKMLEYYVRYYDLGEYEDIFYSQLFEKVCFYIIPMSNPDGIAISQFGEKGMVEEERKEMAHQAYERDKETLIYVQDSTGAFVWQDVYLWGNVDRSTDYQESITYEEYLKLWKANANGVDINRNFDAGWEGVSQKPGPGCEFYKGTEPESEPETRVLKKAVGQRKFDCVVNYHARGQVIYYDVKGNSTGISERSRALGDLFHEQNRYSIKNCKDVTTAELGGFGDWVMLDRQIPSVTIEIGRYPCPLEASEFDAIWVRNRETWGKLALRIIEEDDGSREKEILCD